MWIKIELYFMSLSLLFFLLIIKSINIPIYIGPNWEFVGWEYLLYKKYSHNNMFNMLVGVNVM